MEVRADGLRVAGRGQGKAGFSLIAAGGSNGLPDRLKGAWRILRVGGRMLFPGDRRIPPLARIAGFLDGFFPLSAQTVPMDYSRGLYAVAELPEFIRAADQLLGESELQELISCLAVNPRIGDLLEGTGGIRKLR
ncbi:hypothetical protein [Quisquiliibacterium transsilvanicum]|nr:hypothetical protein [Quisquiliibacterium transsilvanicum]